MFLYNELMKDEYIAQQAGGRIKFYEYPETGDVSGPHIVIDPLDVPLPAEFGDNQYLAEDYLLQVDVWTKDRATAEKLTKRVQDVLWNVNFPASGGAMNEYDKKTGIYRMAKRYRGKVYTEEMEALS